MNNESLITAGYPLTGTVSNLMRSFVEIDDVSPRLQQCAGNPCLLLTLDAPPQDAPPIATATQCQSWLETHDGASVIAVRCYSAGGQLIQCCGHGLLAAAHSWQRQLQCEVVELLMNGSVILSWREGDITWLRFAPMRMHDEVVPHWLPQVFSGSQQAHVAANVGEASDYLVLRWPDGFDLTCLPRPAATLAQWTKRAVICTAARPEWGEGAVQLRYFAPQYGVVEDAATGSAMRVLAQYWSFRFSQLIAYQCSPGGGLLLSRRTAAHIDVGGRCVNATERFYD
jgi:predicted PhzF superfamily epimerase YddE/YHI9